MNPNRGRTDLETCGDPENGKVVVHLSRDVRDAIFRHGMNHQDREVGGILVGSVSQDNNGKYIVDIVGAVEAGAAPGNQSQMQFTGEVWFHLLQSVRQRYPDQKVVGWYHTHPNLGAFLSDDDVASHRVAFSHPWHIACVCDPIRNQFCFFGWDDSELKAIKGFYIYGVHREKPTAVLHSEKTTIPANRMVAIIAPLFIVILVLGIYSIYMTTVVANLSQADQKKPEAVMTPRFTQSTPTSVFLQYVNEKGEIETDYYFIYFIGEDTKLLRQTITNNGISDRSQLQLPIEKIGSDAKLLEITPEASSKESHKNIIGTFRIKYLKQDKSTYELPVSISKDGKPNWGDVIMVTPPPPSQTVKLNDSPTQTGIKNFNIKIYSNNPVDPSKIGPPDKIVASIEYIGDQPSVEVVVDMYFKSKVWTLIKPFNNVERRTFKKGDPPWSYESSVDFKFKDTENEFVYVISSIDGIVYVKDTKKFSRSP